MDKDGKGSISLYDYFGIFESHGIEVSQAETRRVVRLAGVSEAGGLAER